jgi:hypothetical protein
MNRTLTVVALVAVVAAGAVAIPSIADARVHIRHHFRGAYGYAPRDSTLYYNQDRQLQGRF